MSVQHNIANKLNLDVHPKHLKNDESFYLLNNERNREGYGGASTPMTGNYPFGEIEQPAGENYSIGEYKSESTNEVYSWVYNSNNIHYIQRLSDTNGLEVVYQNWGENCLQLSAEPRHAIKDWRATVRLETVYDRRDGIGCKNRHGKYLVWTDGLNPIGYIDVEASIATNSFTTPFFENCADYCSLIRLCVPDPCKILQAELVPRGTQDQGLSNKILNIGFMFIYRGITYDQRASEWSTPSSLYYQSADDCFDTPDSKPRCYKLRVPLMNPSIEKIEIAFFKGDKTTEGNNNVYLSYEVIEKYKKYNSAQQYWYERDLSEVVIGNNYSDEDCSFDYYFCNDKNCNPVETIRTFNPMPITPQGLINIKNSVGFYNYIQGNCPINKFETDKFQISATCVDDAACDRELVDVKVRLVILQTFYNLIAYVYRKGGVFGDNTDDITDQAYYGGNEGVEDGGYDDGLGQPFSMQEFNKARNFVAYIEGTSYFAEMKQWRANDNFTNPEEYGILTGFAERGDGGALAHLANPEFVRAARALGTGAFFYQEATFKVPKGTRGIIRVRSNNSKINNGDTSAKIFGTVPLSQVTTNGTFISNVPDIYTHNKHEITFDTCGGGAEIDEAFVVLSESYAGRFPYGFSGYVRDADNKPIEGLELIGGRDTALLAVTDHNGFYYFSYDKFEQTSDPVSIDIYGELSCGAWQVLKHIDFTGALNTNTITDIQITLTGYAKFHEEVRVHVKDCNNNPVGGIRVAMTGTKYQVTNASTGIATFKVRNYSTRDRNVRGYVMDAKGCFNFDCNNDCGVCTPQTPLSTLAACFVATPSTDVYTDLLNVGNVTVQARGLKKGGRYPMGYVAKGDCGRISAVNELPYLDIPKVQTSGIKGFCNLSYNATGLLLPTWTTCIEIVRGENMNDYELQWVVDSFEKTADNKIKITFQSLIDYNIGYSAKTNTKYQWLPGDRVEFVLNQDGNPILSSSNGILNYLTVSPFNDTAISGDTTTADLFNQILIEDDGKIDFLKPGTVIEFQRPKECLTEPTYFSIGVSIPVVNGELAYPVGTFETFDTYQQRRVVNNGALITFEHHSPSDFWGDHLTDIGKAYFANKYEDERRFNQSITLNSPTQYNYFGDIVKTFDGLSSDIISMNIKDGKVIMIICETDNALAVASDDLLRVGTDGIIRAASPDAVISDGEPKLAGEYGCAYDSIGSVFYGDGFANWYDIRYYSYINNDYRTAKSVDQAKARTYFRKIGLLASATNKTATSPLAKFRFCTGQNMQTKAVHFTAKPLRYSGINNDAKPYQSNNTTILFDNDSEDFLTFASFTPEGYSNIVLNDGFGCAMLTFQNGRPYIHPVVPANYNMFFGIAVDRVVGFAINGSANMPEKNKVPVSMEVQSDMMYYVSSVETSDPNFDSEIPPARVKKTEGKWNASFLSNKNGRGGLYASGLNARDYYIKVTLKRDNTDSLKYGTLDNNKRIKFDTLSLVIFNFLISEQSGFSTMQQ